jgi:hypothetical protein
LDESEEAGEMKRYCVECTGTDGKPVWVYGIEAEDKEAVADAVLSAFSHLGLSVLNIEEQGPQTYEDFLKWVAESRARAAN